MSFGGLILTNTGRALQAKVQAGTTLVFNRIGIGDGDLGSQAISDLNALISEKKSLTINKLKTQAGGKAIVGGVLSNQDIVTGFYFREIGVFAQDPDVGEILYCYANAGAGAEYIPAGGGADVVEKQIDIITLTANAASVTADISSGIYALSADVGDMSTVPTTSKVVAGAIAELFTSVSDGKTLVAAAITGKGVPTAADDTFQEMSDNIASIQVGPDTSDATAAAGDILATKTAYGAAGTKLTGTMPNRGAVTITPGAAAVPIDEGYYDGTGEVHAVSNLSAGNIKDGVTIGGVAGSFSETASPASAAQILTGRVAFANGAQVNGAMANRAGDTAALASSVAGTTLKLRASAGFRDGVDDNVTITDADFLAANIPEDINMFGLQGTLVRGKKFSSGSGTADASGNISVLGLDFTPSSVFVRTSYSGGTVGITLNNNLTSWELNTRFIRMSDASDTLMATPLTASAGGFSLGSSQLASRSFEYNCYE